MTDAQMSFRLGELGHGGIPSLLQGLSNQTTLVQRVVPGRQEKEHIVGYTGPYEINPAFREPLAALFQQPRA
jgi:hypothetical protein